MENFAEAKFLNTDNPSVALRAPVSAPASVGAKTCATGAPRPLAQGSLVAGNNSFTDPDNLLARYLYTRDLMTQCSRCIYI